VAFAGRVAQLMRDAVVSRVASRSMIQPAIASSAPTTARPAWRRIGAAVVAVLALVLCMGPLHAQQVVRVALFPNPPKADFVGLDRPQGLFVDIIEEVARREGWTLQYVPGTLTEGLARLEAGEVDLMADLRRTPARDQIFAFNHVPVLHTWNQVYARPDSGIHTIIDLSGKRIAVLQGSVQEHFGEAAAGFGVKVTMLGFPDYRSAFRAVSEGRADAVIGASQQGALRSEAGLADTSVIFDPSDLFFGAPRNGNMALLAAIDRNLAQLQAQPNSMYFASLGRWTSDQEPRRVPPWFKWAAAVGTLLLGMGLAWALTLQRVAARLRASEAAQRRLAEELSRVFDNSQDAICVFDRDLHVLRVSPACERLWGYTPQELVGHSWLDFVPPEARQSTQEALRRVQRGRVDGNLEGRSLRKDGTVATTSWSAVWSEAQQEMYCVARDETERRQLVARLHRQTAALRLANTDLQTFAQSVSHDLSAPVSAIAGFVDKVIHDCERQLPGPSLALLRKVHAAAGRMEVMIRGLLRLSRIAEFGLERRPVDVTVMAMEIGDLLQQSHAHEVRFTVQPGLHAMADAQLVRIALENLLANAWKFTSRSSAPAVAIGCESTADADVFFVRDNGAGFDMQFASRMFRPFQRLHAADEFEGTGIGLSIVWRVIASHGGRIWAESAPGSGAVFRFTLAPGGGQPAYDISAPRTLL
jgi:PAS domain S-box-containing protein